MWAGLLFIAGDDGGGADALAEDMRSRHQCCHDVEIMRSPEPPELAARLARERGNRRALTIVVGKPRGQWLTAAREYEAKAVVVLCGDSEPLPGWSCVRWNPAAMTIGDLIMDIRRLRRQKREGD